MPRTTVPAPDLVWVQTDPEGGFADAGTATASVTTRFDGAGLGIHVATADQVSRVKLRWLRSRRPSALVLGDAWERSYGELEWRSLRAERVLPWAVLVHDREAGRSEGYGVMVQGGAFAFWQVDASGLTLMLDLRSGGAAVRPGDREIHAATVRWTEHEGSAFAAHRELFAALCDTPSLAPTPVVGANNWYYAYGKDFGLDAVVRDARMISELTEGHPIRPYGVIDDGWSIGGTADGLAASAGPWDRGRPDEFPDMSEAADALRAEGVTPGLWFRPLLTRDAAMEGIVSARDGAWALDPSSPAVLDLLAEDVHRIVEWGFELIKHDFSTYDLLGLWGPGLGAALVPPGPPLHDPSSTTAEALVGFYRTLDTASGSAIVLGCDVIGHLAAGSVQSCRTGDDTSGRVWDRTRRVGVNTLAFRLAQHGTLFTLDADCVASTPETDWTLNRQFLDLVAASGTSLFVSVDPRTRTDHVDADLSRALRLALDGGAPGGIEPLDWFDSPVPSRWRVGSEERNYFWLDESAGANPFEAFTGDIPRAPHA